MPSVPENSPIGFALIALPGQRETAFLSGARPGQVGISGVIPWDIPGVLTSRFKLPYHLKTTADAETDEVCPPYTAD